MEYLVCIWWDEEEEVVGRFLARENAIAFMNRLNDDEFPHDPEFGYYLHEEPTESC